jgi:phage terminase large subunit-like protein
METNLVHGPGDLRGEPYRLDSEKRGLLYRIYEVYPKGHALEGRRRFRRVGISLRKGSAKSELAAAVVACELAEDGPVRTVNWNKVDRHWEPEGGPVTDPYIPMIAYTEEQSDELVYGALTVMLAEGPLAKRFDIGKARIMRARGDGKAVSLATSPDSRDGARTTFEVFDETHRLVLPRHREAHRTMLANLPKRRAADPWSLEITTAPTPGEGSVAEATMDYARQVADKALTDTKLFFFHRQASDDHDMTTRKGIRAAVLEASGPVAEWSDIDGIVDQWDDPGADRPYLERVWLNRLVKGAEQAFDVEHWRKLARPEHEVPEWADIVIGFDGSIFEDSTAVVAVEVVTGHAWLAGLWEKPLRSEKRWQVPTDEVEVTIDALFDRYQVWRLYADPAHWRSYVAEWAAKYGRERVIEWWMYRTLQTARAVRAFAGAILNDEITHSGDERLLRHIGNSHRLDLPQRDEDGMPMWRIVKERPDSPHKIDAASALILAWEARTHAVAEGVGTVTWTAA